MHEVCSKCKAFQFLKRNKKQYGRLPPKEVESKPWDVLYVHHIEQYQFTPKGGGKKYQMNTKNGKTIYLQTATMIDLATGWIEILTVPSACADLVSNIVELAWLTTYPLPSKVIVDRGNKMLAEFKIMIQADYSIRVKPSTSKNPQAYSSLERVHQTIVNIIRTFKTKDTVLDDDNPWDRILTSIMFALRATVHTTTQYTPAQLVFGRDSILNTCHEVNWQLIKKRKQDLINKGNQRENHNQKEHTYNKWKKVLLKNAWKTKFNQDAFLGPYTIKAVRNYGILSASKGKITDIFNICIINPYKE